MTATIYGVTPAGFVIKPQAEIVADLEAAFRATFGVGINLTPSSPFGQLVGIFAERLSSLWQLAEAVYTATTPDGAEGVPLVNVCALTGTSPNAATLSKVLVVCTGTPGTLLTAGRRASVLGVGSKFELLVPRALAAAPAVGRSTIYARGACVTNDGKVYTAKVAGTTSGSSGAAPTGTGTAIVDGSVTWVYVGDGTGYSTAEFVAVEPGPVPANAGSLTVIETPVAGWSGIYNLDDHWILGEALEADPELRMRRESELRAQGNAALDAVRQAVLALEGVLECVVFENATDDVDTDGRPPKSIEVLVDGGDPDAICAAIFEAKAAGVATHATEEALGVADSQGVVHLIGYSRPDVLATWITLNVWYDPDKWPADGVEQIKALLASWGESRLPVGSSLYRSALLAEVFRVSGVMRADLPTLSTNGAVYNAADLTVTTRQIVQLDTARIIVNAANGKV